jgi:hypothetical protein
MPPKKVAAAPPASPARGSKRASIGLAESIMVSQPISDPVPITPSFELKGDEKTHSLLEINNQHLKDINETLKILTKITNKSGGKTFKKHKKMRKNIKKFSKKKN